MLKLIERDFVLLPAKRANAQSVAEVEAVIKLHKHISFEKNVINNIYVVQVKSIVYFIG